MKRIVRRVSALTFAMALMSASVCGGIRIQGVTPEVKEAKAAESDNWGCDFSRYDLVAFHQTGTREFDKKWYDDNKNASEYHIRWTAEFNYFAKLVNDGNTFEGKTVYLENDILVGDNGSSPRVGEYKSRLLRSTVKDPFKGTFDGQKHWIQYISPTDNRDGAGVFGYTKNATIKNLGVLAEIEGESRVGALIGWMEGGTISNCIAHANIYNLTENDGGGIVGRCEGGTIDHCTFTNLYVSTEAFSGGSGIQANSLTGKNSKGGIAGFCTGGSIVRYCVCTGIDIKADDDHVGGIVGHSKGTVEYCRADVGIKEDAGSMKSANIDDAGGIVGKNEGTVRGCVSKVEAKVDGGNVGGVVGLNEGTVEDCYAEGSVKGDEDIGGVCGDNNDKGRIQRCYAKVSVKGDCRAALVGCNEGQITDSYALTGVDGADAVVRNEKKGSYDKCEFLDSAVFETFDEDVMISGGYPFATNEETVEEPTPEPVEDTVAETEAEEAEPTAEAAEVTETQDPAAEEAQEPAAEDTTGSVFGESSMVWIILLVVVVVGVGAGTAVYIRKRKKTE